MLFGKKKPPAAPPPLVAVVVIAYNQERFIGAAIESVRRQTLPAWEMVCVDDGSTDGTRRVMEERAAADGRIRVLSHANHGLSYTRNAGLFAARTGVPFALFLDGDDEILPDCLRAMTGHLQERPEEVAAVSRARQVDVQGRPCAAPWFAPPLHVGRRELPDLISLRGGTGIYPASVILYRRWALEAAGGYNAFHRDCEDDDLNLRVALHGPFWFTAEEHTLYRRHDTNSTNDGARVAAAAREVWKRRPWFREAWNAGRGAAIGRPVPVIAPAPGDEWQGAAYESGGPAPYYGTSGAGRVGGGGGQR